MSNGAKKRILLADDSVTIQKVVELTFSEGDYSVTSVSNGALALEELNRQRPDLVLCDVIMPERNGYEVCEEIKKGHSTRGIPVILLTGTFEPFDPERAKKVGADDVVTKPFDSSQLIEKVEALLANRVKLSEPDSGPAKIFNMGQEFTVAAPEPELSAPSMDPGRTMMAPPSPSITVPPAPAAPGPSASGDFAGGNPFAGEPIPLDAAASDPGSTMMLGAVQGPAGPAPQESEPIPLDEPVPLDEPAAVEPALPSSPPEPPPAAMPAGISVSEDEPAQEVPAGIAMEPEAMPLPEGISGAQSAMETMESPEPFSEPAPGTSAPVPAMEAPAPPALPENEAMFEAPAPEEPAMAEPLPEEPAAPAMPDLAPQGDDMALEAGPMPGAEVSTASMLASPHELMGMVHGGATPTEEQAVDSVPLAATDSDEGVVSGSLADMTPATDFQAPPLPPAVEEEPAVPQFAEPEPEAESVPAAAEPAFEAAPPVETPEPAPAAAPVAAVAGPVVLDEETIQRIVDLVVKKLSADTLREVAWEVVPDMADAIIRERIRELEEEQETSGN